MILSYIQSWLSHNLFSKFSLNSKSFPMTVAFDVLYMIIQRLCLLLQVVRALQGVSRRAMLCRHRCASCRVLCCTCLRYSSKHTPSHHQQSGTSNCLLSGQPSRMCSDMPYYAPPQSHLLLSQWLCRLLCCQDLDMLSACCWSVHHSTLHQSPRCMNSTHVHRCPSLLLLGSHLCSLSSREPGQSRRHNH